MPMRKEKRTWPVTKAPTISKRKSEGTSVSVWWLSNTQNISCYRHLGHNRAIFKTDVHDPRIPLNIYYEDIQSSIELFILKSPSKSRTLEEIVTEMLQWCYRYGYATDEQIRATVLYALDFESKEQNCFFKEEKGKWTITSKKETNKIKNNGKLDFLSEIQAVIMYCMSNNQGNCTFRELCQAIEPIWKTMKKPSGYLYVESAQEAIFAALNIGNLFKRECDGGDSTWAPLKLAKTGAQKAKRAGFIYDFEEKLKKDDVAVENLKRNFGEIENENGFSSPLRDRKKLRK